IVNLRLISENIAVDKEQYPFLHSCFPKSPDDLESGVSFSCPRGHHEKDAVFAASNRINCAVDRHLLKVMRRFSRGITVVILCRDALLLWRVSFDAAVSRPRFGGCRKVL